MERRAIGDIIYICRLLHEVTALPSIVLTRGAGPSRCWLRWTRTASAPARWRAASSGLACGTCAPVRPPRHRWPAPSRATSSSAASRPPPSPCRLSSTTSGAQIAACGYQTLLPLFAINAVPETCLNVLEMGVDGLRAGLRSKKHSRQRRKLSQRKAKEAALTLARPL